MTTPLTQKDSQDAATQQIAREAREQIFNALHFSATERQERITESLILSAIVIHSAIDKTKGDK